MLKEISQRGSALQKQPALKYGQLYFRETSADGSSFSYPTSGQCMLAFSRILDTTEVVVAMNLTSSERQDYVTVDKDLTQPDSNMIDELNGGPPVIVDRSGGRAYLQVKLGGHQMAIFVRK